MLPQSGAGLRYDAGFQVVQCQNAEMILKTSNLSGPS
jgi:hypothetical protein